MALSALKSALEHPLWVGPFCFRPVKFDWNRRSNFKVIQVLNSDITLCEFVLNRTYACFGRFLVVWLQIWKCIIETKNALMVAETLRLSLSVRIALKYDLGSSKASEHETWTTKSHPAALFTHLSRTVNNWNQIKFSTLSPGIDILILFEMESKLMLWLGRFECEISSHQWTLALASNTAYLLPRIHACFLLKYTFCALTTLVERLEMHSAVTITSINLQSLLKYFSKTFGE